MTIVYSTKVTAIQCCCFGLYTNP